MRKVCSIRLVKPHCELAPDVSHMEDTPKQVQQLLLKYVQAKNLTKTNLGIGECLLELDSKRQALEQVPFAESQEPSMEIVSVIDHSKQRKTVCTEDLEDENFTDQESEEQQQDAMIPFVQVVTSRVTSDSKQFIVECHEGLTEQDYSLIEQLKQTTSKRLNKIAHWNSIIKGLPTQYATPFTKASHQNLSHKGRPQYKENIRLENEQDSQKEKSKEKVAKSQQGRRSVGKSNKQRVKEPDFIRNLSRKPIRLRVAVD